MNTNERIKAIGEKVSNFLYDKSNDPDAADNSSQDFRDGYAAGLTDADTVDVIALEFEFRNRSGSVDMDSFNEWKRGYWAGKWARPS